MTRREQRGWWMSVRPKLKYHLLTLPRRLPQPPAVDRRIATWNRRQHSRITSALAHLKSEAGFLSADRVFASRVDQLSVEFDKLVRSG